MPKRATKRGAERTPLSGDYDVLICGASFAGLAGQQPRFVTVIMVDKGGIGGVVAAPAVRQVWDTVFGLEGHKAAFPYGRPPNNLPHLASNRTHS